MGLGCSMTLDCGTGFVCCIGLGVYLFFNRLTFRRFNGLLGKSRQLAREISMDARGRSPCRGNRTHATIASMPICSTRETTTAKPKRRVSVACH